jgi:hypothetical protein
LTLVTREGKKGPTMMVRTATCAAALLTTAALALGPADGRVQEPRRADPPAADQDQVRDFMRHKMELTQSVLAGLSQGDLKRVTTTARNLRFLGYFERHALADRPDYKRQLSYFDFACQELVRQAEANNLEGATLAYTQLTVSCVQCHKVMREARK